jgi:hypothetical protein
MPSLCGSAEATREWFRAFTAHSFLACRPLRPRGVRHRYPETSMSTFGLRRMTTGSALPTLPQSVPRGRSISWLHWFASAAACQVARPPVRIRLGRPALGDFYFQAFNGSVSLPVAGYNYNSDWTPCMGLVWGFFCQEVSAERVHLFPSSVSLFGLKARLFVPTRHGGTMRMQSSWVSKMTIRGEPAFERGSIAPQPCIRWVQGPEP